MKLKKLLALALAGVLMLALLQGKLPKRRSLLQRPRADPHHPARVHPGLVPEGRGGEHLRAGPGLPHRLRSASGRLPERQPERLRAEQFRELCCLRLHRDERP